MQALLNATIYEKNLEQRISERLGDFDLIALLRLLKGEGIDENDIWFSSHNSIVSQKRLIESVKILQDHAFIEVNLGILSPTGILPGYIRQFMDRPDVDDQALQHLFKVFDHLLISSYLSQLYPEINRSFFDDWQQTKGCYLQLQNMRCECSLHWLFETAFPEFTLSLIRLNYAQKPHKVTSDLGQITLGETSQATTTDFKKDSFKVMLYLRPEFISTCSNWSEVALDRLNRWVFPWLSDFSTYLEIHLFTHFYSSHLKLFERSALGYDPFYQSNKEDTTYDMHQRMHHSLLYANNVSSVTTSKNTLKWEDSRKINL